MPDDDHATVIVFDVADMRSANRNRDGACPPPPAPEGKRENHPHHVGGERTRPEQKLNAELLQASYDSISVLLPRSLLQGDCACNYGEHCGRRKPNHTIGGKGRDLNDFNNTKRRPLLK